MSPQINLYTLTSHLLAFVLNMTLTNNHELDHSFIGLSMDV